MRREAGGKTAVVEGDPRLVVHLRQAMPPLRRAGGRRDCLLPYGEIIGAKRVQFEVHEKGQENRTETATFRTNASEYASG